MARNVEFDILARDKASQTFDKVGKHADGLGSKLGSLGKGALLGVGGAAAGAAIGGVAALGAAMVNGVKDAAAYQTLASKTSAVLKSTGNASRQSVKGIQARAAALESLSGVDEELIINGQNVLATFTNIRDGVGKGNDIFNQATTAALNMSTALGQDMQSSTVQLGKALNDPVKGITALSRVGVSFTQKQKDQIKAMVKAGDTMGAQKLILKELGKEFGGAAKAAGEGFNGAMARAKDAVGDAFRSIGTKLLPILTRFADYIASHAGPWIDKLSAAMSRLWGWVTNKLWPALQKGYQTIMPGVKQALSILKGGVDGNSLSWKKVGDIITQKVIPFLSTLARVYLPVLATNIRTGIEAVKAIYKAFQTWMTIVRTVIAFILRKFADLSSMWAGVLRALAKVPGFGWAKDAADKLDRASGKANALASSIERIPNKKNVTIDVNARVMTGRIKVGNQFVNIGQRAAGGPVEAGRPYIVGEKGPELVVPRRAGTVIPADKTASMGRAVGGGGDQNVTVQLVLDGRVVQQSLLKLKRQGGVNLGLA